MKPVPETHQVGIISLENRDMFFGDVITGDLGLQVAEDGRVWVCINGIAFLRFVPSKNAKDREYNYERGS